MGWERGAKKFPCRARESLSARWRVNEDGTGNGNTTRYDDLILYSLCLVCSSRVVLGRACAPVPVSCSGELVRQVACQQMTTLENGNTTRYDDLLLYSLCLVCSARVVLGGAGAPGGVSADEDLLVKCSNR
ncbi:hypothetical protein J6590_089992 [Homalodisca vitripennis]|nr:hypothetical protein J6590_089992 [Homalodisca vitripennis]